MRLIKCSWMLAFVCSSLASGDSPADEPKEKQQPPPLALPSKFAELVRETEKTAETMDQPEAKVKILVELAGYAAVGGRQG